MRSRCSHALFVCLLLVAAFAGRVFGASPTFPSPAGPVTDLVGVLDQETRQRLIQFLDHVRERTGAEIAVLVVDRNENRRRFAEDTIVQNLPAGTQAVPGYLLLGPLDANPDKAKIRDRLVSEGFDGALVARLAGIIEKQTTQPPPTTPARAHGR